MKKIAYAAFASVAALALAACGSSEKASEEATPENVEMPAEEAMTTTEPAATPAATASPTDMVSPTAGATGTASPTSGATAGAEAATTQAEKKM
jgi:hypothetical protein